MRAAILKFCYGRWSCLIGFCIILLLSGHSFATESTSPEEKGRERARRHLFEYFILPIFNQSNRMFMNEQMKYISKMYSLHAMDIGLFMQEKKLREQALVQLVTYGLDYMYKDVLKEPMPVNDMLEYHMSYAREPKEVKDWHQSGQAENINRQGYTDKPKTLNSLIEQAVKRSFVLYPDKIETLHELGDQLAYIVQDIHFEYWWDRGSRNLLYQVAKS